MSKSLLKSFKSQSAEYIKKLQFAFKERTPDEHLQKVIRSSKIGSTQLIQLGEGNPGTSQENHLCLEIISVLLLPWRKNTFSGTSSLPNIREAYFWLK